jgi:Ku70/Ku80 beta-barrel domain/von Willebrand factor type A domain
MTIEAIIFLLDTSSSMCTLLDCSITRLEAAKRAIETWVSDLMVPTNRHEVAILNLKSNQTDHHLNHEHFPNLSMLPSTGLNRPTIALLKEIHRIECNKDSDTLHGGGLIDGLAIATDAMRRRTLGKSYRRSLVIITDAYLDIQIDEDQVLQIVDALRDLDCRLDIVGINFVENAIFVNPLPESEAASENTDNNSGDENDVESDAECNEKEIGGCGSQTLPTSCHIETQRFLISLVRLTGGSVRSAHSLHEILQHRICKHMSVSTKRKCSLLLAPTIDPISVRVSLLVSKSNLPTLSKVATLLDEQDQPIKDGLGDWLTSDIERSTNHFDAVQKELGLEQNARSRAIRYGTDWIPINEFDLVGMKERSGAKIVILGYMKKALICRGYLMGPSYAITYENTACSHTVISALAHAMRRLNVFAVATFVKYQDADPVLTAVFPFNEKEKHVNSLVLVQVPFCNDVPKMSAKAFHNTNECKNKQSLCDQLIDSLMLKPEELISTEIACPVNRKFREALTQRALHPEVTNVSIARDDIFHICSNRENLGTEFIECVQKFQEAFFNTRK